jgi:hypothetical protein
VPWRGDLETKLGLIRSFLEHGYRGQSRKPRKPPTRRLSLSLGFLCWSSHKGFDVVAGDKAAVGTAQKTTNSSRSLCGSRA